ncbi:hypothetical protein [Nocardia asiatica]|uniref:hypothetical protein n=1 Tax=Nocardia asiatica TaxID=209252 RepID=UPI002453BFD3|nr:hypothetical protein [Nocardia asiatica]
MTFLLVAADRTDESWLRPRHNGPGRFLNGEFVLPRGVDGAVTNRCHDFDRQFLTARETRDRSVGDVQIGETSDTVHFRYHSRTRRWTPGANSVDPFQHVVDGVDERPAGFQRRYRVWVHHARSAFRRLRGKQ